MLSRAGAHGPDVREVIMSTSWASSIASDPALPLTSPAGSPDYLQLYHLCRGLQTFRRGSIMGDGITPGAICPIRRV